MREYTVWAIDVSSRTRTSGAVSLYGRIVATMTSAAAERLHRTCISFQLEVFLVTLSVHGWLVASGMAKTLPACDEAALVWKLCEN